MKPQREKLIEFVQDVAREAHALGQVHALDVGGASGDGTAELRAYVERRCSTDGRAWLRYGETLADRLGGETKAATAEERPPLRIQEDDEGHYLRIPMGEHDYEVARKSELEALRRSLSALYELVGRHAQVIESLTRRRPQGDGDAARRSDVERALDSLGEDILRRIAEAERFYASRTEVAGLRRVMSSLRDEVGRHCQLISRLDSRTSKIGGRLDAIDAIGRGSTPDLSDPNALRALARCTVCSRHVGEPHGAGCTRSGTVTKGDADLHPDLEPLPPTTPDQG